MKSTIKILVQPAVYQEMELTFPFYRANKDMVYYKVVDAKNVTQITMHEHAYYQSIENIKNIPDMAFESDSIEITEAEFEAKFNECIELLTNLKNK